MSLTTKRGLFDQLHERQFIAFASGLNFGSETLTEEYRSYLSMLARFLQGNHLNPNWNSLSSRIQRLVLCGDSTRENKNANDTQRGSFRMQKVN